VGGYRLGIPSVIKKLYIFIDMRVFSAD